MTDELNETVAVVDETTVETEKTNLLEAARKVLLAGIGAVVVASESAEKSINRFLEDAEHFVEKLIERGEIAEKDGRQLINEMVEKRRATAQEAADKAREGAKNAEATLSSRVDELVTRISVPTREDIQALTQKVNLLNRKVEQLKKQEAAVNVEVTDADVVIAPEAEVTVTAEEA